MKLSIQNDFQSKLMIQSFDEATQLTTKADVLAWKQAWLGALQKWHSPYKVIVDCSNLTSVHPDLKKDLEIFAKFFKGFFMRSIIGYSSSDSTQISTLPFEIKDSEEAAREALNIRQRQKVSRGSEDFRGAIFLENHFQQQCMELSFTDHVKLDSPEKLAMLKSKIINNLTQWHSPWNLLIDCSNLEVSPELEKNFGMMTKFFQGFFLRQVLGYQPFAKDAPYPFKVYRVRHRAAAELETSAALSGDTANCATRK